MAKIWKLEHFLPLSVPSNPSRFPLFSSLSHRPKYGMLKHSLLSHFIPLIPHSLHIISCFTYQENLFALSYNITSRNIATYLHGLRLSDTQYLVGVDPRSPICHAIIRSY